MLRFSKATAATVFIQFQINCKESMVIMVILFLATCYILKVYDTLNISSLSYIASIHKAMLVKSDRRSSRAPRPLGLLLDQCTEWPPNHHHMYPLICFTNVPESQMLFQSALRRAILMTKAILGQNDLNTLSTTISKVPGPYTFHNYPQSAKFHSVLLYGQLVRVTGHFEISVRKGPQNEI